MTALEALMEALLDPADCWMTSGGTDGIWCLEHDAPRAVTDPKVCQARLQHDAAMAELARKAAAWDEVARKAAIGEAVERLHDITEIDYDSSADGHEWYVLTGMRGGVGTTLDAAIAAALGEQPDRSQS